MNEQLFVDREYIGSHCLNISIIHQKTAKHIFREVRSAAAPEMNSITDTVRQLQSDSLLALSLAGGAFFLFNVHSWEQLSSFWFFIH